MNNHSYNAGYHRGLNTEYHDVPIETLFKKWVEETDIRLVPVVFDPVAFEKGYNDGIEDYEDFKSINCEHMWVYLGGHNEWWVCKKCQTKQRK
jgi:hypothetical protein